MKISDLVEALVNARCTPEAILAAVRVAEADNERTIEQSREKARARLKRWKENHPDSNVSKRSKTLGNVPQRLTSGGVPVEDKPLPQKIEPQVKRESASRLAEDWRLPAEWRQDALNVALPEPLIDTEAANMRDWSLSSPQGAKRDWRAMWRNWCRKAVKDLPRARAGPHRKPSIMDLLNAMDEPNGRSSDPSKATVLYLPAAAGR